MQETRRSTNVFKNIKIGKNCLLENDSNTSTVKFEKEMGGGGKVKKLLERLETCLMAPMMIMLG